MLVGVIDAFCAGFVVFFLMIRRPPRSTRTDTRFPYTTLFRSNLAYQERSRGICIAALAGYEGSVSATFLLILPMRSEEHTSELQSLMRISYAVFCLKKKKYNHIQYNQNAIPAGHDQYEVLVGV